MADDRVNVLMVDDQPNNLLALDAMLEGAGLNLVRADSGLKALKSLLDQDFAVILLDVQMPELDGFETATLIREREKSRHTPIIFVTALSRSDTNVFKGYSLGAVDYLFKPIVPEILRSKVSVFVDLFRKTEEIKHQSNELLKLSRQNQLILEAAAEGVLGVDSEGKTTFLNPAAGRMTGRALEEISGHPIHDFLHPVGEDGKTTCDPESCGILTALAADAIFEFESDCFIRADGSSFPSEFSFSPIRDDAGHKTGGVFTFRDVTERRAAAAAVENERLYREAQAANQAKDDFLATLSHELRTPMTSILGWVQLLRMGTPDPEELTSALETIETSARVQARLIDDMLDVSRIILGKFRLDMKPLQLATIVDSATETVRPNAESRGIHLITSIDRSPATIVGDPNRLQQVIWNLLSNAIKFSETGATVEIALEFNDSRARLSVSDEGQGISPALLPYVFEKLRQAEGIKSHGGLGLGLAIARHIVDLHGGEIRAESDGEGKGARFIVTLPTESHETAALTASEQSTVSG
ncbi:MAG TPA: ATP-binding protein [Thermoanaerobaculia bacterium]|nr:ATP-binding protein [Thermoanaerobaculia bacterium]